MQKCCAVTFTLWWIPQQGNYERYKLWNAIEEWSCKLRNANEVADAIPKLVIILWLSYWLIKLKTMEENSIYLSFPIQHNEITPDTVGQKINGTRLDCLCNQLYT